MIYRPIRSTLPRWLCVLAGVALQAVAAETSVLDAASKASSEAVYAARCASCHDNPAGRIPPRVYLSLLRTPEEVLTAMTTGVMKQQAAGLDTAALRNLAMAITEKPFGTLVDPDLQANRCSNSHAALRLDDRQWNGWGKDLENTGFQPDPGLRAADVPRLKLKWVFAHPGRAVSGRPVVAGDYLFVTSGVGQVFALNAKTGCTLWHFTPAGKLRTAIVVAKLAGSNPLRYAAYFGDERSIAYAVDATSGALLWQKQLDDHPQARISGSMQLHDGRLYVPLSSQEEVAAADHKYPCCTFRGSLIALDARNGDTLWKSHTIPQVPRPFKLSANGQQMFGPAGAAVFSPPTIDQKRGVVYVATGDSYTNVATRYSNALIAFDLRTGKRHWSHQVLANDAWVVGCDGSAKGNCPTPLGPDHDFASPVLIRTLANGKQILIASAKSGIVYAFDPDERGKLLWQQRVGKGGEQGGILWGPAADRQNLYVAVSDVDLENLDAGGGLTALRIDDGARVWHTPTPAPVCAAGLPYCTRAHVAAVTAIPGIVFAGGLDGSMRAYSSSDGAIVWEFATAQEFAAVNGVAAHGGSIDYGGQTIVDGILYVNSGSTRQPGNALLAFSVDGK